MIPIMKIFKKLYFAPSFAKFELLSQMVYHSSTYGLDRLISELGRNWRRAFNFLGFWIFQFANAPISEYISTTI